MKSYYQDLFNIIVRFNHKDLDIRYKQSLSAVIDMFSNEICNNIVNEMKRRGMPLPQMGQPPLAQPMGFVPPI
jgi:hypothetical protein